MGARKSSTVPRGLRSLTKCFCGKKFNTLQALKKHQTGHKLSPGKKKNNILRGKGGNLNTDKMPVEKKVVAKNKKPKQERNLKVSDVRKIEFGCPVCMKTYGVYFSAFRHIQSCHPVQFKEREELKQELKPIRIELCVKCNTQVKSSEAHVCPNVNNNDNNKNKVMCLGCDQSLNNEQFFDLHVQGLHANGMETMFFPTMGEFQLWKYDMEFQTKCNYVIHSKNKIKTVYRCSQIPNAENNVTKYCPSILIVQDFPKGLQTNFYKNHFIHKNHDYNLKDKFKKYSITSMVSQKEGYSDIMDLKSDENDMYLQFKTLMEGIVLDAAKLNIKNLKILLGKALEMTSVLNSYDEDDETNESLTASSKVMSDVEISKMLENVNVANDKKRKAPEARKDVKKVKGDIEKPEINSKENERNTDNSTTPKPDTEPVADVFKIDFEKEKVEKKIIKPLVQSPSTFCESYKHFINNISDPKKNPDKKKTVVKTKIGQFKPNNTPKNKPETPVEPPVTQPVESPKKFKEVTSSIGKSKHEIQYEVKEQDNDCNILILKI